MRVCKWKHLLIVCLVMVFSISFVQTEKKDRYSSQDTSLKLTKEEKEWLRKHPRILVGVMNAWPPLNYQDNNKKLKGIGIEYLSVLNKRLNGALVPVSGPFQTNFDRVKSGELDALMDVTQRSDRDKFLNFTRPYISIPHVIVAKKNAEYLHHEQYLEGKILALEKGFYNVTYLKKKLSHIQIKEYDSTSLALDAVSRGEADAYAGNRAVVSYLIEEELFHDLELMGRLFESRSILQFGVKKSEPLLVSILDKALASITIEEEKTIARTWLDGNNDELILSPREKDWLAEHKTIRMAIDHSRPPIAFFYENGIFQEMSSDYINKIEKILGINFKQVKINNLLAVTDGSVKRDVDLFPCLVKTMEREKYLNFTDIYLSIPVGIFFKKR